jgi:DnaK suppressor protein
MENSEVVRLERYMTFHLAEIVEELNSSDELDLDAESTWSAKMGSSAKVLKQRLLRSRDEITLALERVQEGTYGHCIACGNEIDPQRLETVPWLQLCIVCQSKS